MTITYARAHAAVSSADGVDPASASFTSGVTEGNMLTVQATERSGGSAANFVISDNGSNTGWNKQIIETTLPGDTNARRTFVVWWREVTATDDALGVFTVTVNDGTANGKRVQADEWTAGVPVTWTFQDDAVGNTGTGSTSPVATGSTVSISGEQLMIGLAIWRNQTGGPGSIAFTSMGGVASAVGGNNGRSLASAFAQSSATGTKSAEVSWTGTGHEGNVGLLVFTAVEDTSTTDGVLGAVGPDADASFTADNPTSGTLGAAGPSATAALTGEVASTEGTLAGVGPNAEAAFVGDTSVASVDGVLGAAGPTALAGFTAIAEAPTDGVLSAVGPTAVAEFTASHVVEVTGVLEAVGPVPVGSLVGDPATDGRRLQPVTLRPVDDKHLRAFPVRWRESGRARQ